MESSLVKGYENVMYKIIAVDMDGTLLNDNNELPENTYEAARYLEDNHIKLVLCTGRPLKGVIDIYDSLKLSSPIVTNNGAMVYLDRFGPLILNQTLSIEEGLAVLKLNELFQCATVGMWHDNKLYLNEFNEYAEEYAKITGITPLLLSQIDLSKSQNGPTKFVFRDTTEKITAIKDLAVKLAPPYVTAVTTRPYFLEFFSSRASKSGALQKLGETLNISSEEMMAVGDGFNDLDMIKYAGLGIAVSNSPEELKEQADYIGCSNNEGIIAYIVENILKK